MNEEEESKTPSSAPDEESTLPDTLEEQLATTLYLAGEAIVPGLPAEPAHHAVPKDDRDAPIIDDFEWLKEITALFRQALADNPKRAELLHLLPQGLGDGEILWPLFRNLFPQQRGKRKVYKNRQGKSLLSESQAEILRWVARGASNPEIAEKALLPPDIAQKSLPARIQYVGSALQNINRKLNTDSRQEAVAVAISMGYLGLDAMDFVFEAGRVTTKDFSVLDTMLSQLGGVENVADPTYWQELSAFGLMLMIASGAAILPQTFAAETYPTDGVVYQVDRLSEERPDVKQVIGPGRLRHIGRLTVAPFAAKKKGFNRHIFVVHNRATLFGRNMQEIVEFDEAGAEISAFCGGRTEKTSLRGTHGLVFSSSGALFATSSNNLLRFTRNGQEVQWWVNGCCTDVCIGHDFAIYLAHYSSQGGSLRIHTKRGGLKHEFAQQTPGDWFSAIRLIETKSEQPGQKRHTEQIVALRCQEQEAVFLEFYDTAGRRQDAWPVPEGTCHSFALDVPTNRIYLPNHKTKTIQVFTLAGGTLKPIALEANFTPRHIAFGNDGALWLSGVIEESLL